ALAPRVWHQGNHAHHHAARECQGVAGVPQVREDEFGCHVSSQDRADGNDLSCLAAQKGRPGADAALPRRRFVSPAITHAVELVTERKAKVERTHAALQKRGVEVEVEEDALKDDGDASEEDERVTSRTQLTKVARRPRQSPFPLIAVEQAQAKVLSKAVPPTSQTRMAMHALGYALAEDVYAREPLPPFPASVKDGYAVLATDGRGPRRVIGQSCAGIEPHLREVAPGTCMRVNTGAPVPPGSDAVVQVEDTKVLLEQEDGSEEVEIEILKAPSEGQDIRPKGSDISLGELLLTQGQVIGPAEVGIMASAGVIDVSVHKKPVVAVLSTGNELQNPSDNPLLEGHIYDSNKVALLSLLQQHNIPSFDGGIARDDATALLRALRRALRKADILVTSGGVSMGERDLLRPVLTTDLKAKIHFAQVFMKPGKPTTFATCTYQRVNPKLIWGLPGNPVSAIVTAHLYLLPLCRKMSGVSDYHSTIVRAKLSSKLRLDPRPEYHRATLSWSSADNLPTAHSTGNQMSSRLMSMAFAQALLQLPPASKETTSLPAGSVVEAIVLRL
ncbi:UNVERIFIED_CONTAM: hypothetical protein GTU68_032215, partial [Idotea baltica]|nr:hypothetical protein [Idotea baltica]